MPGCAAVGCSNRPERGFLMKAFPRDPVRRKEWVVRMKRDKWTPTNRSVICEAHFETSMWEKTREDGSRRLKGNAVPTIFYFSKKVAARKPPKKRNITIPQVAHQEVCMPSTTDLASGSSSSRKEDTNNTSSASSSSLVSLLDQEKIEGLEKQIKTEIKIEPSSASSPSFVSLLDQEKIESLEKQIKTEIKIEPSY